jgi:hypothetical protein
MGFLRSTDGYMAGIVGPPAVVVHGRPGCISGCGRWSARAGQLGRRWTDKGGDGPAIMVSERAVVTVWAVSTVPLCRESIGLPMLQADLYPAVRRPGKARSVISSSSRSLWTT